ncbi:phosphatidylcholine transfer [Cyclospora cayetanensis]|uniref:Phosphatidylcholine transfer n=1 Tax=Cyclospora cayetanensis TaxID=88456 RepID=A0A1D3CSQ3_9EIME|nr:phosphatidylcholine transfer [Cyclospora cayetanensis]
MRWANYHFATSQSQLQLIFKVVMEYQVLTRLGGSSKTARSQLKLLYHFLRRDDVGQCLWHYLDYFLLNFRKMTRSEISMCFLVCQVCTQCVVSLRKRFPPVVDRMQTLLDDDAVMAIFKSARATSAWRQKPEAEKEQNAILCADASKQVQRHVMKGGDLVQAWRGDAPMGGMGSETSQESQSKNQTSEDELSGEEGEYSSFDSELLELTKINSGDLKPNSEFNVALPPDTSLEGYRSATLRQTPAPPSKSVRSAALPEAPKAIGASVPPPGPARLFKSYEDLVNFDTRLKHQTPIGSYEMQFLEEKEPHDSSDPMWELTVDQATIKVYKYNSPDSPVVLVKAYATLEGIPVKVELTHTYIHVIPTVYRVGWRALRLAIYPLDVGWDTTFGDYRVVEQDVDGCEMIYCLMKAPFPVSNRDFLQWRRTEEDPEAKVTKMLMRSADHPSVPEKSGVVRAETLISGYIMAAQPNDASSSTLFILAQTDVKGLIPKWVVNTTAARAPVGWVDSLKKACKAYIKQYGDFVPPYNPIA